MDYTTVSPELVNASKEACLEGERSSSANETSSELSSADERCGCVGYCNTSVRSDEVDESSNGTDPESDLESDEMCGLVSGEEMGSELETDLLESELSSEEQVSGELSPPSAYLFPESRISSLDFNIAFMSLVRRRNLTYSSQTDILDCYLWYYQLQILHHRRQVHF